MPKKSKYRDKSIQYETLRRLASLWHRTKQDSKCLDHQALSIGDLITLSTYLRDADDDIRKIKTNFYEKLFLPSEENVFAMKYILTQYDLIYIRVTKEIESIYERTTIYDKHIEAVCKLYSYGRKMIWERSLYPGSSITLEFLTQAHRHSLGLDITPVSVTSGTYTIYGDSDSSKIRKAPSRNKRLEDTREQLATLSERVAAESYKSAFSNKGPQPKSDFRRFRN